MENLNKAIITEITGLAIDVQNAGISTVFVDLQSHVSKLFIRIYTGGWRNNTYPDVTMNVDLLEREYEGDITPAEAIKQLTELLTTANV